MAQRADSLKPRKKPSQARSAYTVESIHEACIQVLCDGGLARLTTTKVAERAGVSVGTFYQYYPNKRALLASVLEAHLGRIVASVEAACDRSRAASLQVMSRELVTSYLDSKFARPIEARALFAVTSEVEGEALVAAMTQRARQAIAAMLTTTSDGPVADVETCSFVIATALIGPVHAALRDEATDSEVEQLRKALIVLVSSYLTEWCKSDALP